MVASIALGMGMFMIVSAWTMFMTIVICHAVIYSCLKIIVKHHYEDGELIDARCCDDLCGCQCCYHSDKEVNKEE